MVKTIITSIIVAVLTFILTAGIVISNTDSNFSFIRDNNLVISNITNSDKPTLGKFIITVKGRPYIMWGHVRVDQWNIYTNHLYSLGDTLMIVKQQGQYK